MLKRAKFDVKSFNALHSAALGDLVEPRTAGRHFGHRV